jgi:hypothetical protein
MPIGKPTTVVQNKEKNNDVETPPMSFMPQETLAGEKRTRVQFHVWKLSDCGHLSISLLLRSQEGEREDKRR